MGRFQQSCARDRGITLSCMLGPMRAERGRAAGTHLEPAEHSPDVEVLIVLADGRITLHSSGPSMNQPSQRKVTGVRALHGGREPLH
jgi:hypothetical protein